MKDCLLLVDVIADFRHDDGEKLLVSFRERFPALERRLTDALESGTPVVYANDNAGVWNGDGSGLIRRAVEEGAAGELVAAIAPQPDDRLIVKPRYSAFDLTPLELILRDLEIERILLAGTATEACVAQTAIAARDLGFKVTVFADACATVDPRNEQIALAYLANVVGVHVQSGEARG